MPLLYKAVQSSLATKDGKKKWYPSLVKLGSPVTTKQLGIEVSKRSSMAPGDTMNVVDTVMDVIRQYLMNGRSVRLDDLGTFTVIANAKGHGVDTEEEVTSKQIQALKIRFTPSYTRNAIEGTTRAMYADIQFEKYEPKGKGSGAGIDPGDDDDDVVDPDA